MPRKTTKDVYPVPDDIKMRVFNKVHDLINKFEDETGFRMPMPEIYYNVKGRTAGYAGRATNTLEFNPKLLIENIDHFIDEDTVPHEVGHRLCTSYYANKLRLGTMHDRSMIHGKYWKKTMAILGFPNMQRCHNYSAKPSRQQSRYAYTCGCSNKMHELSSTKHNRMVKFRQRNGDIIQQNKYTVGRFYYCSNCKQILLYTNKKVVKS